MNNRIKTPFVDGNGTQIFTDDILKHYCYVDDPDRRWDYDIGIVYEADSTTEPWRRTTLFENYEDEGFFLSDKCFYLIIGNTDEPRTDVAVRLWYSLSNKQKEEYYYDNGIIGFLENFCITNKDEPLTDEEIEYALDKIMEQSQVE